MTEIRPTALSGYPDASYAPHRTRTRPMEVLALGLPRTGTASMALALAQLGFQHCAHGMDLMDNMRYTAAWEPAVAAKYGGRGRAFGRAQFDALLGHCSAVTDVPAVLFWRELHAAYPAAKVVLVQRDEARWFRSFSEGIIAEMYSRRTLLTRLLVEPVIGSCISRLCMAALEGFFAARGPAAMRANARAAYRAHYADVRATIPAAQLLEYQLGSGWEPLCEFLGRPVPEGDFPWINEAEALKQKIHEYQDKLARDARKALLRWIFPIIVAGFAVLLARRTFGSK